MRIISCLIGTLPMCVGFFLFFGGGGCFVLFVCLYLLQCSLKFKNQVALYSRYRVNNVSFSLQNIHNCELDSLLQ